MTTTVAARRPVVGWLIALAGLFAGLPIVLVYVAPSLGGTWVYVVEYAALTLAFLFLFLGRSAPLVLRIAFAIATVGWAILVAGELVSLGVVLTVGFWLAVVGTLISGVLVLTRLLFSNVANVVFLLAAIVTAVVLVNEVIGPFYVVAIVVVVAAIDAVLLLLAGILIAIRK
jgi:hypothetical protein